MNVVDALMDTELVSTKAEALRCIRGGAVVIDGSCVFESNLDVEHYAGGDKFFYITLGKNSRVCPLEYEKPCEDTAYYKAQYAQLMNTIGELLQEAQENPMRLVAFNSPLLGILSLEYHSFVHNHEQTAEERQAIDKYKAVLEERKARIVDLKT